MCDAFLVTAQSPRPRGLSCFFLPRLLPDGGRVVLRRDPHSTDAEQTFARGHIKRVA